MPIKRYKPEQIVTMLRQIEVGIANGKTTPQACKEAEATRADVLALAEGIWRTEDRPGEVAERTRERERQVATVGRGVGVGQADPIMILRRETSKP